MSSAPNPTSPGEPAAPPAESPVAPASPPVPSSCSTGVPPVLSSCSTGVSPVPPAEGPAGPTPPPADDFAVGPEENILQPTVFERGIQLSRPGELAAPAAAAPPEPIASPEGLPANFDPFAGAVPPDAAPAAPSDSASPAAPGEPGAPATLADEVPDAGPVSRAERNRLLARQAAKAQLHNMKKLLAPICVCMAVLMFLIGSLAVLHLFGLHRMWGKREYSTSWILMSCWLVGGILTYGAVIFFRDMKAYELAQAEEEKKRQPATPIKKPVPAFPSPLGGGQGGGSPPSSSAASSEPAPATAPAGEGSANPPPSEGGVGGGSGSPAEREPHAASPPLPSEPAPTAPSLPTPPPVPPAEPPPSQSSST